MRINHPARLLVTLLAAMVLTASAALAAPQRHRLPGGLTLITSENHEAPVVSFQVWVRAGSAYERPGEYGITHLIEHMIFKGTPSDPGGTMARRIEALGGEVNAYTSIDHTNYYVVAASRNAAQALTLLADAVVNASFDPAELAREKEVVVEEIRMNQDNPRRRLYKEVSRFAMGDHPYGRPVIGTAESVRAMTREGIRAYVKRWYRAPAITVVAVGDFNTAKLIPLVRKAFAGLNRQKPPAFKLPPVTVPAGPRIKVMTEKVKQASLVISWRIPGLPHPDVYPLDMAATVLGDGATSRLYSRLKEELGLVDSITAWSYTPQGQGIFSVQATTSPDKVAAAWPAIIAEVMKLMTTRPRPQELDRARVNLAASFVRSRMTMAGQARMLGKFEMFYGGFEQAAAYLARFQAVGPGDVVRVAAKYFIPSTMTMVIQSPAGTKVPTRAELAQAASRLYRAHAPADGGGKAKSLRVVLANGLTVVVKPARAVPLVSMVLASPGGSALETKTTAGIYELWSRSVIRGSRQYPYRRLIRTLEDMAGSLDASSGKSEVGLSGSFLARDWKKGLAILADVWLHPTFEPRQVARAKAEQLAALRRQADNPVGLVFKRLCKALYGDSPFGLNYLGTPETLAAMDSRALERAHQRIKGPGGTVLVVVGDVDPAAVVAEVKRLMGSATGKVILPAIKLPKPHHRPVIKSYRDPKAKQTQIVVAFLAPNSTDPQRHHLSVLQAAIGGMGGSLFTDLRDKRSLAYSVQPFYTPSRWGSSFGVYMAVGPGKQKAALDGLEQHLKRVRTTKLTPAEIKRAKGYLLGELAIGLQSYGSQASIMATGELLGLGYDYYRRLPRDIEAVTAEQVLATARKYLAPNRKVQLTQGPVPGQP